MSSTAKVLKVSESNKSIFVKVINPANPFDSNGIAGYCANPEGKYKLGDIIPNFPQPTGTTTRVNGVGELLVTKTGESLSFLTW